jgi:hypothetical protein
MFNEKQGGKYFCIFSNGEFSIGTMPILNITNVEQLPNKPFIFVFLTDSEYKIKCNMSWGNGGAGNQNPRILFKLLEVGDTEDADEDIADGNAAAAELPLRKQKLTPEQAAEKKAAQYELKAQKASEKKAQKQQKAAQDKAQPPVINEAESPQIVESAQGLDAQGLETEENAIGENKAYEEDDTIVGGDPTGSEDEAEDDEPTVQDEPVTYEEEDEYDWFTMHEELAIGNENAYDELLRETGAPEREAIQVVLPGSKIHNKYARIKKEVEEKNIIEITPLPDAIEKLVKENYKYSGVTPTSRVRQMVLNQKAKEAEQSKKKGGKKTRRIKTKKIKKTKRIKKLKKLTKRKNKKNKKTKKR